MEFHYSSQSCRFSVTRRQCVHAYSLRPTHTHSRITFTLCSSCLCFLASSWLFTLCQIPSGAHGSAGPLWFPLVFDKDIGVSCRQQHRASPSLCDEINPQHVHLCVHPLSVSLVACFYVWMGNVLLHSPSVLFCFFPFSFFLTEQLIIQ